MKKIRIIAVLALFLGLSYACSEDELIVKNENAFSDETYFASASQFNEAVVGTYSVLLHQGMYARDWYFIFDLLGNDAEKAPPLLGDLEQLHDYSHSAPNPVIKDLWQALYRIIFRANLVIDRASDWTPSKEEEALKNQYLGEAYFLKGLGEMYLVSLWGRVPLKPDYETSINDLNPPRASEIEVWAATEADLQQAINLLPESYDDSNLGRVTRNAAIALLGKVLLYQEKWAEAEAEFNKILGSYDLNPDFDNQFSVDNTGSSESVFQVIHATWEGWGVGNAFYMFGGQESWGGRATHTGRAMEYGFNDWQNVYISDAAVDAFTYADESGANYTDPRAAMTFYGEKGGDMQFCDRCDAGVLDYPFEEKLYRWRKYQTYEFEAQHELPQSHINSQVIRFADVLLMLAEAQVEQGKTDAALEHINRVRSRAGAFEYSTLGDQGRARELVRRERQLELAGEQVRWFDLNRWGIAKETLNAEKQNQIGSQPFQDKHVLLPIPQVERDANPNVGNDVADNWN
ncbi:MAG: RagB/SusD family nutrient uptake outer membrane protein [Bacteroidota bacterium]